MTSLGDYIVFVASSLQSTVWLSDNKRFFLGLSNPIAADFSGEKLFVNILVFKYSLGSPFYIKTLLEDLREYEDDTFIVGNRWLDVLIAIARRMYGDR